MLRAYIIFYMLFERFDENSNNILRAHISRDVVRVLR